MILETIAIDRLIPAPYNPRITLKPGDPGWEKLRRSLQEFDLVQPIIWNRQTGHVVGGHQRLAILKQEGWTSLQCVVVDLPPERERALNVTLNNAKVGGDWDADGLQALLEELHDLPDFDPTLTGFNAQELQDLLFVPEPSSGSEDEDDERPPTDQVTVTLQVPLAGWPEVKQQLDQLLAHEPSIELHVHWPESSSGPAGR